MYMGVHFRDRFSFPFCDRKFFLDTEITYALNQSSTEKLENIMWLSTVKMTVIKLPSESQPTCTTIIPQNTNHLSPHQHHRFMLSLMTQNLSCNSQDHMTKKLNVSSFVQQDKNHKDWIQVHQLIFLVKFQE